MIESFALNFVEKATIRSEDMFSQSRQRSL